MQGKVVRCLKGRGECPEEQTERGARVTPVWSFQTCSGLLWYGARKGNGEYRGAGAFRGEGLCV